MSARWQWLILSPDPDETWAAATRAFHALRGDDQATDEEKEVYTAWVASNAESLARIGHEVFPQDEGDPSSATRYLLWAVIFLTIHGNNFDPRNAVKVDQLVQLFQSDSAFAQRIREMVERIVAADPEFGGGTAPGGAN